MTPTASGLTPAILALLLLACATIAMLARRLRLPYTVVLLLGGWALTRVPGWPDVHLTRDLIFSVLLPPLIFEAALALPWHSLRPLLRPVLLMATAGLLLAAAVTAVSMHVLAGWTVLEAGIFGVLMAATDPVSVIATFRENRVPERLRVLVEAESLFNDGTSAVLFSLVLMIGAAGLPGPAGLLVEVVQVIGGGLLCGAVIARALVFLTGHTEDHLVEITLSVVAAWGTFLLAEHWGMSGVLATLTAGLIFGAHQRDGGLSVRGQAASHAFWEFAAFVANALVFLLIGIHTAQQAFWSVMPVIVLATGTVLAGRVCAVYPLAWLFRHRADQLSATDQQVLVWGGLRGALGLALALGLPDSLARREQIITVTCAVVVFSVVVQGLTMPALLRRLGVLPRAHPVRDSGEKSRPD